MSRIRTFIAVDPGKSIRERLILLQQKLMRAGTEVKWVEADNLHVTLLFLGEVENREIASVCKVVQQTAGEMPAFSMSVEGVGCFPNERRPRILWAGVGEGAQALVDLHAALEEPLQELGYRREERRYTPHLTLGRVKSDRPVADLAESLARNAGWKAGEVDISHLLVMSSELKSNGPEYTVLARARLG